MTSRAFEEAWKEIWLAKRLKVSLLGTTTRGMRRARLRQAIVEQKLEDKYGPPFERLYGVPIHVTELEYAPMEESR